MLRSTPQTVELCIKIKQAATDHNSVFIYSKEWNDNEVSELWPPLIYLLIPLICDQWKFVLLDFKTLKKHIIQTSVYKTLFIWKAVLEKWP